MNNEHASATEQNESDGWEWARVEIFGHRCHHRRTSKMRPSCSTTKKRRRIDGQGAGPVDIGPLPYLYRWDRKGRKGQRCQVLARGRMNSCLVEFADGFRMVTSRNALRKAPPNQRPATVR